MTRATCRGCREPIRWAHTHPAGCAIPLNPRPDPAGTMAFVVTAAGWRVRQFSGQAAAALAPSERWMPHAATCRTLAAQRGAR